MKICWDNIEGLYLTRNGYFRKNTTTYIVDVCLECGDEYLKEKRKKRRPELYCSKWCSNKGKNNPNYGKYGEESAGWKGGEYRYFHRQARVFETDVCEICGRVNSDGSQLHMHNTLEPKDYTIMESHAWQCLCYSCHAKIERS